jgi:hypothetical protein
MPKPIAEAYNVGRFHQMAYLAASDPFARQLSGKVPRANRRQHRKAAGVKGRPVLPQLGRPERSPRSQCHMEADNDGNG